MKKKILLLGCSGSIGQSTLKIIEMFPDMFQLTGLTAHTDEDFLLSTARKFSCANICLTGKEISADILKPQIPFYGLTGLKELIYSNEADIVVNGIAGSAGLLPSKYALESGKDLALANKETIVMAGSLIKQLAQQNKCSILPVDSEHSAVFTLLRTFGIENTEKIILTASGGPFRLLPADKLKTVKASDALKHPTWNMGHKITIDSASLANKGLEVIEASVLFDLPCEQIETVVHPESLIHSMIRTHDGVLYAQISKPDMCHPILTALDFPHFSKNSLQKLDFSAIDEKNGMTLSFFKPRYNDFPMLSLAYSSVKAGGSYSTAYNAANEIAADLFYRGIIGFTDIASITESVLEKDWSMKPSSFEDVFEIDTMARSLAAGGLV